MDKITRKSLICDGSLIVVHSKAQLNLFSVKDPKRKVLAKELEEEENILKQCIEKLKSIEASRLALVAQLKEALNEQVDFLQH